MSLSSPPPPPTRETWLPSRRIQRLAAACLILCALYPVLFIVLQTPRLLQNMPMWDEFETVLDFILHYRVAGSFIESLGTFFATANEHVMLTSRLVMVVFYKLTGEVNFVHLAIAGNAFILLGTLVLGHSVASKWFGLLTTAVACLLVFQMQNYENLFSSYASIDHFQIVLLTTTCLFLLSRGTGWQTAAAGIFAALAVFTLAHGIAVLVAGAWLLFVQKRRRTFRIWVGISAAIASVFLWRLGANQVGGASFHGLAGLRALIVYWLTMLGGIVSLGSTTTALCAGLVLVLGFGALLHFFRSRLDPFLCAIAVNTLLACALIAYGRFNLPGVPPLSSRYMVQSAIAWTAVAVLAAMTLPSGRRQITASAVLLVLAAILNVAASRTFMMEARQFSHRRTNAARYYDERGTFEGLRLPIFPKSRQADRILAAAADAGIFHVAPDRSDRVALPASLTIYPIIFHLDKAVVTANNVHLRGWMLTQHQVSTDLEPYLLLKAKEGGNRFLFRGLDDPRPDVMRAHPDRTDTGNSGFYCIIPRRSIPPGDYEIDVVLIGGRRALYNVTPNTVQMPADSGPVVPAAGSDSRRITWTGAGPT